MRAFTYFMAMAPDEGAGGGQPPELSDHISPAEAAAAGNPHVGSGTPETAPWEQPAVSWLRRQPIIAALLVANIPIVTALVATLQEKNTDPTVASVLAVAIIGLNVVFGLARRAVTPTAQPQLDSETPLVAAPR